MNHLEFQLRGVGDPRLARHATSALPAWLWAIDGRRILWANPVGARLFGTANGAVLAEKTYGPANALRRQVARLANRLPANGAVRLERLQGFGARLGALVTCGCARLDFADGSQGVLIAAAEPLGRAMPLVERLQLLVKGIDSPAAAFTRDGIFVGASATARALPGFHHLAATDLGDAPTHALKRGRIELPVGSDHMVLQAVGSGPDVGLVALIASGASLAAIEPPRDDAAEFQPEAEAMLDDPSPVDPTPAGFALVDEFAEPLTPDEEATAAEPASSDYEAPAQFNEAPAEFVLDDEFIMPAELQASEPETEHEHPHQHQDHHADDHDDEDAPHDDEISAAALSSHQPASHEPAPQEFSSQQPTSHEPSPYVEPVADEPASEAVNAEARVPEIETAGSSSAEGPAVEPHAWHDEPAPEPRHLPLRFLWQMDADGRFMLGSDEFNRLIGARTAAGFGRSWRDIADNFALDPDGRVLKAIATRDTWTGITLNWPVDGSDRLPVELSGLPLRDRTGRFTGYRGFGVSRDLDALTRLDTLRHHEALNGPPPQPLSAGIVTSTGTPEADVHAAAAFTLPEWPAPPASAPSPTEDLETLVDIRDMDTQVQPPNNGLENVVPFRPMTDAKSPALTPVENNAFNELARQLAERLERENGVPAPLPPEAPAPIVEPPIAVKTPEPGEQPDWLAQPEPPARGESRRDRALLDLLPVGVLIYRLDRLVYANAAFLDRMGYRSLHALEEAGGLDALYVEPGVSSASSTSDTGTPVTISATQASPEHTPPARTEARLYTIAWDGEQALALIFSATSMPSGDIAAAFAAPVAAEQQPALASEPSPVGHANAEELAAILDTTAEGILMFDAEGNINSCNRSAEALFGFDGADLVRRNLTDLFAPESAPAVREYLERVTGADVSSLFEQGRDLLARVSSGGLIPVSMTMGRTQADGPNFFAVFRDLSQAKKSESDLREARRMTDRAASAKGDMLARISHEVRTPLNAIIGFAEVMISERFGSLGNERYVEYMKDIRASGERVIAIINDLLDLSRIETGKLDLAFTTQNLNDLVEQCVAVMQPQANRERIIIRTSLAHMLPHVVADSRALRQITLNLIGTSIHLANAGGQVIVSTALSDFGEVVLRVRDTGHGLNDNEVAAALEPFRTPAPSDQTSESSGVSLSLTKALVEANRAQFQIKTGGHSGTLIEVLFPHAMARA